MARLQRGLSGHGCLTLITLTLLVKLSQSLVVVDKQSSNVEDSNAHSRAARNTQSHYSWVFGSWTSCSQQCGIGYQLRAVSCIEDETGEAANTQFCSQNEVPERNKTCIGRSCQDVKWIEGLWGDCSVDCGVGEQTQIMHCVQTNSTGHSSYATDNSCVQQVGPKPVLSRTCIGESDNCPYWATGSWSECSVTCGAGIQTSNIYCQQDPTDATQDPVVLDDSSCLVESKPQRVQICSLEQCADGSNRQLKASEQLELNRNRASCWTSTFGCCQNNITPARGNSFFGCPDQDPCQLPSELGPCNENVVMWYFDANAQVCTRFWYGGCEGNDNRFDTSDDCKNRCLKKDLKQENNVIRCRDSQYGCCADGVTSAQGPRRAGCPESVRRSSCSESQYGCCADGVASAQGPRRAGCPESVRRSSCSETQFGCCADGSTAATGPNYSGCLATHLRGGCAGTRYGCCQDKRTSASGPNKEGCPEASTQLLTGCHQSAYGCCSDNVNYARGPDGEGCQSFDLATCEQPKDSGTCRTFVIHWYFDTQSKSCRQFWYGGCGGNSNKFTSQQECESKCVRSAEPGPQSRPSKVESDCSTSEYGCCPDQRTPAKGTKHQGCQMKCEDSTYGCCPDGVTPAEGPNQESCDFGSGDIPCNKAPHGCCPDGITAASGPLNRGCGNTPDSEETPRSGLGNTGIVLSTAKCTAPVSREQCTEFVIKWRFDGERQECVHHWWGGCQDNGNVFESDEDCIAVCKNTVSTAEEKCVAQESREVCKEYSKKWRYDNPSQKCVPFWWGGCRDNGNVFESQGDCEAQCMNSVLVINPESEDPDFVNICDMPRDVGPCNDRLLRHYYDPKDRQCRVFYYGGCQGNENNFVNVEDCKRECMPNDVKPDSWTPNHVPDREEVKSTLDQSLTTTESTASTDPSEVCLMKAVTGNCRASFNRWFYDHNSGSCSHFVYGGCGGNSNNFQTVEECNNFCSSQEVCHQSVKSGSCFAAIPRFYYESSTGSCQSFVYGGCQGNLNNFATREACNRKCSQHKPILTPENVDISGGDTGVDVCQLKPEKGRCRGYNIMWYFNTERNECLRFVYTGCDGNGNQFETEKDCSDRCLQREGGHIPDSVSGLAQTTVSSTLFPRDPISPLRILPGPTLIHIRPGEKAVFHCQAAGSPEPQVYWNRNGRVLPNSNHYNVFGNGTLIIKSAGVRDAGDYECIAENGVAVAVKRKIHLSIKETFSVDIQSHQGTFIEGETIHLLCKGTGYPPPKVEWMKEEKVLSSDGKITVDSGELTIRDISVEDAGMYKCFSSNGKDRVQDVTSVQIKYQDPQDKCVDNMSRTKCQLIVSGRLCGLRIFASKCCQSCKMARFL